MNLTDIISTKMESIQNVQKYGHGLLTHIKPLTKKKQKNPFRSIKSEKKSRKKNLFSIVVEFIWFHENPFLC